jgi:hypothetical protein
MEFKIGLQVPHLLGFAPTGIPKKRKGIESILQERKLEAALIKLSSTLIP